MQSGQIDQRFAWKLKSEGALIGLYCHMDMLGHWYSINICITILYIFKIYIRILPQLKPFFPVALHTPQGYQGDIMLSLHFQQPQLIKMGVILDRFFDML